MLHDQEVHHGKEVRYGKEVLHGEEVLHGQEVLHGEEGVVETDKNKIVPGPSDQSFRGASAKD